MQKRKGEDEEELGILVVGWIENKQMVKNKNNLFKGKLFVSSFTLPARKKPCVLKAGLPVPGGPTSSQLKVVHI